MEVRLNINNEMHHILISPDEFLIETLRKIGIKSVKRGCDTSSCGVCSVAVDNKLVSSCSFYTIRGEGKKILTVEGIAKEAEKIAGFLTDEGVEQCGYCSPGLVMAIYTMKFELENPDLESIKHYLAGNLCRCSGYEGQHRAILKYLEVK
jgi:carbon-monoxide dehydrogenase small subunit